jgi:hypothetical protein
MAIATLQAAAASREHAVGAVAVAGAPARTIAGAIIVARPHPWAGSPFVAATVSALISPVAGATSPLDAAAAVGAPSGTLAGAAGTRPCRHYPGPPQSSLVPRKVSPWAPLALLPPQPSLALLLGRPSTRPWAELRTGRRRSPSSWHPNMAFQYSPPRRPLTCPWVEPRIGRRRTPSLRHPIWLFGAADGTFVHAASATAVVALDGVVRGVGLVVLRRLPQLDGARSPRP